MTVLSHLFSTARSRRSRRAEAALVAGLAFWLVAALPARPETDPARPPPEPGVSASGLFFSTTQRFAAAGFSPEDKLKLLTWTEEVADRVEHIVGMQLPYRRTRPLLLLAGLEADEKTTPRVVFRQRTEGRRLFQELELIHPDRLPSEDLLEALSRCMLNAVAHRLQGDPRQGPPELPAWLYCGLAQDLYPNLKARNRRSVLDSWRGPEGHSLETITSWIYLPTGFWPEKAYCGALFSWLRSPRKAQAPVPRALLLRAAQQPELGVDDLVDLLPEVADRVSLEQEWDLWIASLQYRRYEVGTVEEEDFARFKALVELRGAVWAALAERPPGSVLSLDMLASERGQAWTAEVAGHLDLQLRQLSIGRSRSFQETVDRYRDYLQSIRLAATPARAGKASGPASGIELRKALANARAGHRRLEQDYLRGEEQIRRATRHLQEQPAPPAGQAEDAVKAMLDRAEAELNPPGSTER